MKWCMVHVVIICYVSKSRYIDTYDVVVAAAGGAAAGRCVRIVVLYPIVSDLNRIRSKNGGIFFRHVSVLYPI
jgi:hypothetical protein